MTAAIHDYHTDDGADSNQDVCLRNYDFDGKELSAEEAESEMETGIHFNGRGGEEQRDLAQSCESHVKSDMTSCQTSSQKTIQKGGEKALGEPLQNRNYIWNYIESLLIKKILFQRWILLNLLERTRYETMKFIFLVLAKNRYQTEFELWISIFRSGETWGFATLCW